MLKIQEKLDSFSAESVNRARWALRLSDCVDGIVYAIVRCHS